MHAFLFSVHTFNFKKIEQVIIANLIMFAVVVLLTKPREHIIVPESYIFGLEKLEDDLKTWGANKQHDHLIFWSKHLLDDDIITDETNPPDFSLTISENFPPSSEANVGCYFGRIKRFFSKHYNNTSFICVIFDYVLLKIECF